MLLGLAGGWLVFRTAFSRRSLPLQDADRAMIVITIAGIIGSHAYHLLQRSTAPLGAPLDTWLGFGGYAWYGGVFAGAAALVLVAKKVKVPTLEMMDLASPAAALGYAIGRLGCLFAGDGDYGVPTTLPWGMSFPNGTQPTTEYVHPTPLYESVFSFGLFLYLWRLESRDPAIGRAFANYLILSGSARFLVEFLRINPKSFLGLTNAQLITLFCITAGFGIVIMSRLRTTTAQSVAS
jgi:phosphatidylglycerol:prolipoprotein diacylglycerol transferase